MPQTLQNHMNIIFPSRSPGGNEVLFEGTRRFVLIGANGSRKTRLGIWLEERNQHNTPVHRIDAQKVFSISEYALLMNSEQAEKNLHLGRFDEHASIGAKKKISLLASNCKSNLSQPC
jgi:hypothetical protein